MLFPKINQAMELLKHVNNHPDSYSNEKIASFIASTQLIIAVTA